MKITSKIFLLLFAFVHYHSYSQLSIVLNGKANAQIVLNDNGSRFQQMTVNDFIKTIEKASGAALSQVNESGFDFNNNSITNIVLGPSKTTAKILGENPSLLPEEYKIITKNNHIVILANDIENKNILERSTLTTAFALSYILETHLGVKWYWPGDLGKDVPLKKTIELPNINHTHQPLLLRRRLSMASSNNELLLWNAHHNAIGERIKYNFGHSYRKGKDNGDWWEEFKETKPYLLAQSPNGKPEQRGKIDFFKICTSHPESTTEVLRRWEAAGMPDMWDVTPNDGKGFCTCDGCRKIDKEIGHVEYSKEDIWNGLDHVNLTERHVHYWNGILKKMHEKNPRTKILTFQYSAYITPPVYQKLEPGYIGEMVHDFDFSHWQKWVDAGVEKMGLRPNWWHMGANGPYNEVEKIGNYIKTAHQNKMSHLFMDALNEHWATQGLIYYVVGRLANHPNANLEDLKNEYYGAFGKGKNEIKNYFDFWEKYHQKVAYNIPVGGQVSQDKNGIYETVSKEKYKFVMGTLQGHYKTLPYIYNESILTQAREYLKKASKKAKKDKIARQRIDFLNDGLILVEKTSAFILAQTTQEKIDAIKSIKTFDNEMEKKHGYWGKKTIYIMNMWGMIGKDVPVEDM